MNVGDRIRQRRIALNMTQDELARKVGYKTRASINNIELKRDIPMKKLKPIADALEISVYDLMGWEEKNNKYSHVNTDYLAKVMLTPGDWELLTLFEGLSDSERSEIISYVNYVKSKRKN